MKRPIGIEIEGCVYTNNDDDLNHFEFCDAFIEFIESKGWNFGGAINPIDEEGKKINSNI